MADYGMLDGKKVLNLALELLRRKIRRLLMSNFNSQKIIAPIMRFVNLKGIIALKDGMLAILPLTVVGSLFLIIGQLPFEGLNQAIASVFGDTWTEPFMQVYSGTFAIMGLISCFSIGYSYV